jgi:hypothetical protein
VVGEPSHHRRYSRGWQQTQKGRRALAGGGPQQPPDVVTRCAQHRVQPVANLALQMAAVHPVVGLQVPDHRLNGITPFDELKPFGIQPLGLTPVRDGQPRVSAPTPRYPKSTTAVVGLMPLSCSKMVVCSICSCNVWPSNGAPENAREPTMRLRLAVTAAHLCPKLEWGAGLAFAEAVGLRGVPAVQLGLPTLDLLALGLVEDPASLGKGAGHGLTRGPAQRAELAVDLPAQAADDGALALECLAHALVLLGMGVAPSLAAQVAAFLGQGLLELDALVLGGSHQLSPRGLQHLGIRGVGDGLVLDGGVDDDGGQTGLGDELQGKGHIDRLLQQGLHTYFAHGLAEVDQLGGVAGPAVLEVIHAREVLPGGRLGPALNDALVALLEGVLDVKQRDHQAHRQARTTGPRDAGTDHLSHAAEQIHILNVATGAESLGEQVGDRGFQFLPRHAGHEHGQRVAQIDHLIQAAAQKKSAVSVIGLCSQKPPENEGIQE